MNIQRFIIMTVLLVGVVLSVTACDFGGGSNDPQNTGDQEEFTGIIKPLGVSIYQEGSHRLEEEGALKVILQSNTYNLYNFEEAEVKVAGRVRDTVEGSQRIMIVTGLDVLQEADDRIKRTQTYASDYHTFQFEYPPRWKVLNESRSEVNFGRDSDQEDGEDGEEAEEQPFFSVRVAEDVSSFSTWLKSLSFEGFDVDVETLMRVDGRNATRRIYRSENADNQIISISLPYDEVVFHFVFDSRGTNDLQQDKGAFYDMIDSFSFSALLGTGSVSEPGDTDADADAADDTDDGGEGTEEKDEDSLGSEVVDNPNLHSEAVDSWVSKGYTTFESSSLGFGIDVPKVWYYSGFSGVTGVIYRYGFTDFKTYQASGDDINLGNLIMTVDIVSGSLGDVKKGASKTFGSNPAFLHSSGGNITIYIGRDDHTSFVVKGGEVLRPILEHMAESVRTF